MKRFRTWLANKIDPKVNLMTATGQAMLIEAASRKYCNTGCRTTKCANAYPVEVPHA